MSDYGSAQLKIQQFLCENMRRVYRETAERHQTHAQMLDRIVQLVYETPQYKKANRLVLSYVAGVQSQLVIEITKQLHWRVMLDGCLIPGSQVPAGRWNEVVSGAGAHVYNDAPDCKF